MNQKAAGADCHGSPGTYDLRARWRCRFAVWFHQCLLNLGRRALHLGDVARSVTGPEQPLRKC